MRLAGGSHSGEGRVEVYFAGEWGTVCDLGWNINDAKVVCNMLGYPGGIHATSAYFGEGIGPVWFDNVICDGSERNLTHCSRRGLGVSNCRHDRDAGVVCYSE